MLYERVVSDSSLPCVAWQELGEDDRDDVRHQVRLVLDILRSEDGSMVPGQLGLPPPLVPPSATGQDATDPHLRLTGS